MVDNTRNSMAERQFVTLTPDEFETLQKYTECKYQQREFAKILHSSGRKQTSASITL